MGYFQSTLQKGFFRSEKAPMEGAKAVVFLPGPNGDFLPEFSCKNKVGRFSTRMLRQGIIIKNINNSTISISTI